MNLDNIKETAWQVERDYLGSMPNFTLWHLNIKQAAELLALDSWYSGQIDNIGEPEGWNGTEYDPLLLIALTTPITQFETRLINAVELGRLKTVKMQRNWDEQIISTQTYINFYDLTEWLDERGYLCGDILSEWSSIEGEVADFVSQEVHYLRAVIKENQGKLPKMLSSEHCLLLAMA